MQRDVHFLDSTFRDGLQGEGAEIESGAARAIQELDRLGIRYLELGFAVHEAAQERIREALALPLSARVAAFGRTHPNDLAAMRELYKDGLRVAVLVGKSRRRDAVSGLRVTPERNIDRIRLSVAELKEAGFEVIYDAEHFFDGWLNEDAAYVQETIEAALAGGADRIVLCDTTGGTMPEDGMRAIDEVSSVVPLEKLGFHGHDDCGLGVANSLAAYRAGVDHIQGCLLPKFGERCANATLSVIMPTLVLKYGVDGELAKCLPRLYEASRVVADVFNGSVDTKTPYIGDSAFYTEAGMHQSGMDRDDGSYLHCDPTSVGNRVRIGLSDQSGRSSVVGKATELGLEIPEDRLSAIVDAYRERADAGILFGQADASFELFLMRQLNTLPTELEFVRWRLFVEKDVDAAVQAEASLKLIMRGEVEPLKLHNSDGDGPVNALDAALRRTLKRAYPDTPSVRIQDFKVRMVDQGRGSASRVRVVITFSDGEHTWSTLSVHENILEASWEALWDGYLYKIHVLDAKTAFVA